MTIRKVTAAAAMAAALGMGGPLAAQTAQPASPAQPPQGGAAGTQAQQVNPSPMPPGSRANQAPGMGQSTQGAGTPGSQAQQVNPTPMPPGSRAGEAPGMSPAQRVQGTQPDRGVPGGTGAQAPSAQPDVQRGTAPMPQQTQTRDPGAAPSGAATTSTTTGTTTTGTTTTGTTTPGTATQGGGTAPPAVTTQHTEPRTAAAPVAGANSFTEGQARARIGDAGFSDVQGLRLDDQGIWRGRAMRNGQQTGVALDYQGNVVVTQ